jgi:enoyl-CoA hydratase/carnithine racemase
VGLITAKEDGVNSELILMERKGHVAVLTINRPQRKNAFDESLFNRLGGIAQDLKARPPRAVVISGAGETSFSAGFDVNPDNPMLDRIIKAMSSGDSDPAKQLIRAIRKTIDDFISIQVPLIAALNGSAYGGGAELAVRCDLRVMDPGAVICFSEVSLGLMPDWGGGPALARLIGPSRAADLILTARKVSAPEAFALGLVNRISQKGCALNEALSLAEMIAENGPRAIWNALALLREYQNIPYRAMLDKEEELAAALISSGECIHGVGAFLEKKKPVFPDIQ